MLTASSRTTCLSVRCLSVLGYTVTRTDLKDVRATGPIKITWSAFGMSPEVH